MNKYGIDNVRGGSYTDLILSPVQYQFISNKLKKLYKSSLIKTKEEIKQIKMKYRKKEKVYKE
jgi:hypothetical protein